MSYVYYALILIFTVIVLATLPAFVRLIQKRSFPFDGVKTCCALLAASITNNMFIRGADGWSFPISDPVKALGSVITGVVFVMLVVVIHRTESALRGGKS